MSSSETSSNSLKNHSESYDRGAIIQIHRLLWKISQALKSDSGAVTLSSFVKFYPPLGESLDWSVEVEIPDSGKYQVRFSHRGLNPESLPDPDSMYGVLVHLMHALKRSNPHLSQEFTSFADLRMRLSPHEGHDRRSEDSERLLLHESNYPYDADAFRAFEELLVGTEAPIETRCRKIREKIFDVLKKVRQIPRDVVVEIKSVMPLSLPIILIGAWAGDRGVTFLLDQLGSEVGDSQTGQTAQEDSKDAAKRLENLKLPEGISDSGVLFMTTAPIDDSRYIHDTLLSNYSLSEAIFKGNLLGVGWDEGVYDAQNTRLYSFTIPSPTHGEVLPGQKDDKMTSVNWPYVFNHLFRDATDEELKKWLIWWYEKTFKTNDGDPVGMKPDELNISRGVLNIVESVEYNGPLEFISVNEVDIDSDIPETSVQSRLRVRKESKPIRSSQGKLLLYTGADGQDIRVPEDLLKDVDDYNAGLTIQLNGKKLPIALPGGLITDSIRKHLRIRDELGPNYQYDPEGDNWTRFVDSSNQFSKVIVNDFVLNGVDGVCNQVDALLEFWRDNTHYKWESGVEVERPPALTFFDGGDCNNQAVGFAYFLEAAGIPSAIVYAKTRDDALKNGEERGGHALNAIPRSALGAYCAPHAGSYTLSDDPSTHWVLVEPQGGYPIGEHFLTDVNMVVDGIFPLQNETSSDP